MNQKDSLKGLNLDPSPPPEPIEQPKTTEISPADIIQKLSELKNQANFMLDSPNLNSRRNFSFPESPISVISPDRVIKQTPLTIHMTEYLGSLKRDVDFIKQKLMSREEILVEKAKEKEELVTIMRDLEDNLRKDKSCACTGMCAIF